MNDRFLFYIYIQICAFFIYADKNILVLLITNERKACPWLIGWQNATGLIISLCEIGFYI